MMHEIFGRKDGLCGGKGGSMHIADLSKGMLGANGIVGGGPPLICGAALTAKTLKTVGLRRVRRRRRIEPGYDPRKLQPRQGLEPAGDLRRGGQRLRRGDIEQLVGRRQPGRSRQGLRDPSREVDGSDFFEVYEAAGEAIERAREGRGPSLLHSSCTATTATSKAMRTTYRGSGEVAQGAAKDPLMHVPQPRRRGPPAEARRARAIDAEVTPRRPCRRRSPRRHRCRPRRDLMTDVYLRY